MKSFCTARHQTPQEGTAHFGGSYEALRKGIDFVDSYPAMQNPQSLRSVVEQGLTNYIGVYVRGGHPPMVDSMQEGDLGDSPLAAALPKAKDFRAALEEGNIEAAKKASEGWQYKGYRLPVFSNDEEHYVKEKLMAGSKVPFYVLDALQPPVGSWRHLPKVFSRPT